MTDQPTTTPTLAREALRGLIANAVDDGFAASYFDRSDYSEGPPPYLQPWSWEAEKRLRERCSKLLNARGVRRVWSEAHRRSQSKPQPPHDYRW